LLICALLALPAAGRWFFGCARPDGPKPHGKCAYFKWVEKRAGDHALTTIGGGGGGGKGGSGGSGAGPGSKRAKS
jgi:hypothetical protein